ncbi:MAG: hypothetical protein K0M40_15490 [Prolixibacteraceae bacterium]|nr:hypothetical protein [Prolixibacteraceae bacterium]
MKKTIVSLSLVLISSFLYSQEEKESIKTEDRVKIRTNMKIDQSILSPSESIQEFVNSKDQIIFKFRDVNTFLYSINFREIQRDVINDEELTNNKYEFLFKHSDTKIVELSFTDFQLPILEKTRITDTINLYDNKIEHYQNQVGKLLNDVKQLVKDKEELIKSKVLNIQKDTSSDSITTKAAIQELSTTATKDIDLISLNAKMDSKHSEIRLYADSIDIQIQKRKKLTIKENQNEGYIIAFSRLLFNYLQTISKINEKLDVYNELLFLLFSNDSFNAINNEKEQIFKDHFGENNSPSHILHSCNEMFNSLDTIYYALLRTYASMPKKDEIKTTYSKLTEYHNKIDKLKYQELFRQILKTYSAINEINWTVYYQTTNISAKADKIFFSITLEPIKNEYTMANRSVNLNYDFDIKGGIKIDFSAGIFYHFNLYDDEYRFEKETETTTRIVKENMENQIIPSIGALFNIYKRTTNSLKLALNFGAGTNVEKIFYYTGGSLLIGKSERIGINAGIVGGTVKRILSEYKNSPVINLPIDKLMQSKNSFQIGYFFGVSYNLTGKNNENMAMILKK